MSRRHHVYISASVREPHLLDAALLVFNTIRIGFPDHKIHVAANIDQTKDFYNASYDAIKSRALSARCERPWGIWCHQNDWIANLIKIHDEPFWLCDTDMVFHDSIAPIEDRMVEAQAILAGEEMQMMGCPLTGFHTASRLHTSLMYVDPLAIKNEIRKWNKSHPIEPNPPFGHIKMSIDKLIYPALSFDGAGKIIQHDTMGQMFHFLNHAGLGHRLIGFTDDEMDRFDHVNAGSYSDVVSELLNDGDRFFNFHRDVCAGKIQVKGLWRKRRQSYERRNAS